MAWYITYKIQITIYFVYILLYECFVSVEDL